MRAQRRHPPGVPVGRLRVDEGVVAVVPQHDQAQVRQRSEHGGPGPDHDARPAAQDADELPVAALRALVGGQGAEGTRRPGVVELGGDPGDVGGVRDHDDHPARGLREHRPHQRADLGGPGRGRGGGPHGAGRRSGRGREPLHQRRAGVVGLPQVPVTGRGRPGAGHHGRALGPGVPRGHGRPHDVAERPRIAGRDLAHELQRVRGEDRLDPHHPLEHLELTVTLGRRRASHDDAVGQPAGEAHPHARPHARRVVECRRHPVVEGPVQVRDGRIDHHLSHRIPLRERDAHVAAGAAHAPGPSRRPHLEGELLGPGVCHDRGR